LAAKTHGEAFERLVNDAKSRIHEISISEVAARLQRGDRFHFVDVREESEWAGGRAKGAIHLGKGVIERDIETAIPDRAAEIVLYCGGGYRSALAADNLQKMGYTKVLSMAGGMRGWRESRLPEDPSN